MSDRVLSPVLSAPVKPEANLALIARLLPLDLAVFLVYLTIGAPLPVIPLFVNDRLGFDPIIVGIVIGAQAAATLLARPLAGGFSDRRGTRAAAMGGALIIAATPLLACLIAYRLPAQPVVSGARIPLREVFGRIWRPGAGVALSGVGFAVIAAFITLYYQSRGWNGAAYGLTAFGGAFIVARFFFGGYPDRFGGARVALACLAIEIAGQLLLWLAPSPAIALLGAALTGFGYSLAFPALCLEAVRRVPPQSRGSAIGAYVVCLDFSLASAGPVAGLLVAPLGYSAIYLLGAGCAALAAMLTIGLLTETTAAAPRAAQ